ncbi:MAG TPA: ribbon-helix-helix protein, CopG family [Bryobacteraceae bacterium]|nr:ribbon-helix-helix protein, CopG family [Bryobacteraceae bacterium]
MTVTRKVQKFLMREQAIRERGLPSIAETATAENAGIRECAQTLIMFADGDNMIRTQISLDAREYKLVKKEAKALGVSVAEFVRRAVRDELPASGSPPWMRYAGFVETGDLNSSQSIDDLIYGTKD